MICSIEERSSNFSKPLLLGLNLLSYLSFIFIILYFRQQQIQEFLNALCGFYGILYLAFCLFVVIFGSKTCLLILTKKKLSNAAVNSTEH